MANEMAMYQSRFSLSISIDKDFGNYLFFSDTSTEEVCGISIYSDSNTEKAPYDFVLHWLADSMIGNAGKRDMYI